MKPTILVLFVVLFALAVVSANHHKKHRGNNVKVEASATTFYPSEDYGTDDGDFEWPDPSRIQNYGLPSAFGLGRSKSSPTEVVPAKHHGRSGHGSP